MENRIINVVDVIKKTICVDSNDAQKIFEATKSLIKAGESVTVSFEGYTMVISLFLNVAIGQLYESLTEDRIREHLQVVKLDQNDVDILKRVVDNAKKYYANSNAYKTAWEREVGRA